ncbi:endoribonuclease Dicer homolog 2-like [Impatiens glandulifera]|uniref:endoribonuclease Dicer homolog 2-like n=1 Tax=Impatiens glandulifera TaxID=253017 RepID=UPI001FB06D1C|nr:endoribonuclease Dicer homolog 2-like [Impatiens glandulifera]
MGEPMEEVSIDTLETTNNLSPDVFEFARNYQVEARDKAIKQNTIVFLETGSGKTLIAIMLLRNYAYLLRKPSKSIAVFLVPTVVLVQQQAKALERYLDLSIGKYWGEMGVDFWDGSVWKQECLKHEVLMIWKFSLSGQFVLVMTPMILLNALRHSFIKLEAMKVLIFDECHNARGKHAYACIMKEFYHPSLQAGVTCLPRIFGMTASPVKGKGVKIRSLFSLIKLCAQADYACCLFRFKLFSRILEGDS